MPLSFAVATLVVLILGTALIGLIMRKRQGTLIAATAERVHVEDLPEPLHDSGTTLLQFSTEMCSRCPQVRRLLTSITASRNDLSHIDIDLTHRPDLARRYNILSTPTTFIVDPNGAVRARFVGIPRPDALAHAIPTP